MAATIPETLVGMGPFDATTKQDVMMDILESMGAIRDKGTVTKDVRDLEVHEALVYAALNRMVTEYGTVKNSYEDRSAIELVVDALELLRDAESESTGTTAELVTKDLRAYKRLSEQLDALSKRVEVVSKLVALLQAQALAKFSGIPYTGPNPSVFAKAQEKVLDDQYNLSGLIARLDPTIKDPENGTWTPKTTSFTVETTLMKKISGDIDECAQEIAQATSSESDGWDD